MHTLVASQASIFSGLLRQHAGSSEISYPRPRRQLRELTALAGGLAARSLCPSRPPEGRPTQLRPELEQGAGQGSLCCDGDRRLAAFGLRLFCSRAASALAHIAVVVEHIIHSSVYSKVLNVCQILPIREQLGFRQHRRLHGGKSFNMIPHASIPILSTLRLSGAYSCPQGRMGRGLTVALTPAA